MDIAGMSISEDTRDTGWYWYLRERRQFSAEVVDVKINLKPEEGLPT